MIVFLGAGLAGLLALGGWQLWVLSRTVAQVCHHLDGRAATSVDAQLDQFWRELWRLQERHARSLTARQDEIEDRLSGIEPWVRHLAALASREAGQ